MAIELFDRMRARLFAAKPEAKPPAKMNEELARNAMTILSRWTASARIFNPDDDLIGIKGMEVYEKMRHDDQVKAALQFKKSAALSTGWTVTPASDKKADTEAADFVTWCVENFDPLYGSLDDILAEVLSALAFGFCLHGDTIIHTLSGDRPIKDLVGRRPWVFSWDGDALRPARAKRVWRSKRNALCVKVTYEWWARGQLHESSIVCTDSHPFMLLDGTYMRARQLKPGDRLTPFSQKVNHPGYGKARATVKASGLAFGAGAWQKRSQWVWEQMHGPQPSGTHVHHIDADTMNDEPENLQLLAERRHKSLTSHQWWRTASPEAIAVRNQNLSDAITLERRVQMSQLARKMNLRTWQDPVVRAKRIAGIKRALAVMSPDARANQIASTHDPERRRKISEGVKASWERRRERERNHRVVSVEPWGVADVYDMEVPGYHNFAANSVFVHNSVSELILKQLDTGPFKGKIGLRTIKVRKPHEFVFDMDEFDNLKADGLRQSWTVGKGMPIDKFLIFSYQREFGNFRGVSDLRAAYRGWWLKDNLWSWTATYAERFSIPLRTATYPPGTYPEGHPMRALIGAIHDAIDNLQANTALTFPSDFQVAFHEASGQGVNVLKFLFDHCNQSITRSILMPSQLGFSAEGSSGSYARSKVQFDAFMLVIDDLRRDLAQDVLNGQLIPRLISWNFSGLDAMPKFEWLPFTESDEINLMNAWMLATQYGLVTPTPEDEAHIRAATKFPERDIDSKEEKAVKAKNDAAVKKIQDQADAVLNPKPKKTGTAWGAPADEWGASWGQQPDASGGDGAETETAPTGWGAEATSADATAAFAADPEFENKHPRGQPENRGRFIEKPGGTGDVEERAGQRPLSGSLTEFEQQALTNMQRLSRTAKGISDTSSSADKPKLVTEGEELAQRADANFRDAVRIVWAKRNDPMDTAERVEALVKSVAATVSRGLLPEGASLWRQHETNPKFQQTPVKYLRPALQNFYADFAERLSNPSDDPIATAAWVERVFDSKIHGLADGSGRTTKLLSALVLSRAGLPQPTYPDKQTYYSEITRSPESWERFYRGLFPKPSVGERLRSLPARAVNWLRESERLARQPVLPSRSGQHGWGTMGGYASEDVATRYFAQDPEFETLHPRDPQGQWADKPDGSDGGRSTLKANSDLTAADMVPLASPEKLNGKHYRGEVMDANDDYIGMLYLHPNGGLRVIRQPQWARTEMADAELPGAPFVFKMFERVRALNLGHSTLYQYRFKKVTADAAAAFAVDPEFEAEHPRGQGGLWAKKPEGMTDQPPLLGIVVGDGGVTSDLDALRSFNPRTQPHEFAKAYTLALAAAGSDHAKVGMLVEMLPPELRGLLTPSFYKYSDANGTYTPERAALHEQTIQKYLDAYVPDEMSLKALERGDTKPSMILLAGGTGAGKTTTLNALGGKNAAALGVNVASDDIKVHDLPEWATLAASDYWEAGAGVLHEESSYVAKQLLNRAMAAKKDIVYDATLRSAAKARQLIDRAKAAGYQVQLLYVDADANTSLQRAEIRANVTKRWVPENFARVSHAQAPPAFREYSDQLDRWFVFQTGEKLGDPPRLVSVAGNDQHIAVNEKEKPTWDRFILKMGGLLPKAAVHSVRLAKRWSARRSDSDASLPGRSTTSSDLPPPARSFSTEWPKTSVQTKAASTPMLTPLVPNAIPTPSSPSAQAFAESATATAARTVDFAQVAETLDTLEADAAVRLKATLGKMLNAVQSVVAKKIATNDLSLGFVKALDLKYRAEMTAVVRDFLGLVYRSGKELGGSLMPVKPTYARRTHRTPQGLAPEKALKFFDEKSLWITGMLKQRLLDDVKAVLYNAIKGGTSSPVVIQQMREVFDPWLGDDTAIDPDSEEQVMPYRLETILRTNASESYAEGVKDSVQEEVEDGYVTAFRSVAILDSRTTEVCELLADKCFRPNSDELEVFSPPRHWNCRSLLVPVTIDEGPVEFITPEEAGEALGLIPPGFGGRQKG